MQLSDAQKKAMFGLLVNSLPPDARSRVYSDRQLGAKFKLTPEFWYPLDPEIGVERSSLYNALRAAIAGRKSALLKLRDGSQIRTKLGTLKGGLATLQVKRKSYAFPNADLLSINKKTRRGALTRALEARPLPVEGENRWHDFAATAVFADEEFLEVMTALESTPEALRDRLAKPQTLDSDKLMPGAPDYYIGLVGRLGGSNSLSAYITDELRTHFKALHDRHPKRALRRAGFIGLWQPLIPFDVLSTIGIGDITSLLQAEDPFSLLSGFELCCTRSKKTRSVVQLGTAFLTKLLLEEKASRGRCNIFSACAILSMTNIRRAAKAANAPPFWTRLAALAHAGVLTDALRGVTDTSGFLRWSSQNWLPNYLWHGVVDLRDAPSWDAEWIMPNQLYAELAGRALNALHTVPESNRPARWVAAIEEAMAQLRNMGLLLSAHFPGPFDDFRDVRPVSSQIPVFDEIEAKLEGASAFSDVPGLPALAYAARPSEGAVTSILRLLSGPVDAPLGEKAIEVPTLRICAHIAAVSRNIAIANAVINRCLFLLNQSERTAVATDLIMVAVQACAAHSGPCEHRKLIESTLVRCAFTLRDGDDRSKFLLILDVLCIRDERLVPAVARARAITLTQMGRN